MSKKYHPVYLLHVLFILGTWGLLFFSMFRFPQDMPALTGLRLFYGLCITGGVLAAAAFVLLRLGGLAREPAVMYRRTLAGDGLLLAAAAIVCPACWLAREQNLFLCVILGFLVILQTHVPLPEDEEFDPPEFKDQFPDPTGTAPPRGDGPKPEAGL